jgi:uncharacterized protein YutD
MTSFVHHLSKLNYLTHEKSVISLSTLIKKLYVFVHYFCGLGCLHMVIHSLRLQICGRNKEGSEGELAVSDAGKYRVS